MILSFLLFSACKHLMKRLTRKCGENFFTRFLRRRVDYLVIITRFFLESCVEIGLSGMICVLMMDSDNFKSFGDFLSTVSAFLCLIILALVPFYFYRLKKSHMRDVALQMEAGERYQPPEKSSYAGLFEAYRQNARTL